PVHVLPGLDPFVWKSSAVEPHMDTKVPRSRRAAENPRDRRFSGALNCPRSPRALIAIAATAEKPPDEERHDGGCVGAAPGRHVDVMVDAGGGNRRPITGRGDISKRAAL